MVERIDVGNRISETTLRYHLNQNIIRTQMYSSTMPQREKFEEDFQPPEIDDSRLGLAEFATELRETFRELSGAAGELVDHDHENIISRVEDFVQSFEDTMDFMEEGTFARDMDLVRDRLRGAVESTSEALSSFGIDLDEAGRMTIREEAMEASIEENMADMKEILTDLAARIENIAEEVLRTPPSRYMGKEDATDQNGVIDFEDFRFDQFRLFDQLGRSVYPFPGFQGLIFDFTM